MYCGRTKCDEERLLLFNVKVSLSLISKVCGAETGHIKQVIYVFADTVKPVYKSQNFENHQAQISQLILSETVFVKEITSTMNWNDTRSAY